MFHIPFSLTMFSNVLLPTNPCFYAFLLASTSNYILFKFYYPSFFKTSPAQMSLSSFLVSIETSNSIKDVKLEYMYDKIMGCLLFLFLCIIFQFQPFTCKFQKVNSPKSEIPKFHLFYIWVKFHCLHLPHFHCPFICWWITKLITLPSNCE